MRIAATALALVGALAATGVVESAEAKAVCTRGADARTIEIISPGVVGESCDVRYTRSGNASVPYHADNASDFCARKARELVQNSKRDLALLRKEIISTVKLIQKARKKR